MKTVREIAVQYYKKLSREERSLLFSMINNDILCCKDLALENNIPPESLNAEFKMIMGVK